MKKLSHLVFGLFACQMNLVAQGPLTPPGLPEPTMRTLEQIEPRTPIDSVPITIDKPGSYYFTRDLTCIVLNTNGIEVTASDVTIDMMGFALTGPASGQGVAINQDYIVGQSNLTVRNGFIHNWRGNGFGLRAIDLGDGATVENVLVSGCEAGIGVGNNSRVSNCNVRDNSGTGPFYGVIAGAASLVVDCLVAGNASQGSFGLGIAVGSGGLVRNCEVRGNEASAIFNGILGEEATIQKCRVVRNGSSGAGNAVGIVAQYSCLIEDCYVTGTTGNGARAVGILVEDPCIIRGSIVTENGGGATVEAGIYARDVGGTMIENCMIRQNEQYGILLEVPTQVKECVVESNIGMGIRDDSEGHIERNTVRYNATYGIFATNSPVSFIVANRARGNTSGNFVLHPASYAAGPITTGMTNHPWANFSH